MATTLAPVDSREVVRCDRCLLVQFRTTNNLCRRCHGSLDEDEPVAAAPAPMPQLMPQPGNGRGHLNLASSIRQLRLRSGLSQRQLATRMAVPRTYVSKIERGVCRVDVVELIGICEVLGLDPSMFVKHLNETFRR